MVNILAVTSHVVYGHVGAQASVLPLQRAGHEVWHLPTVVFSHHPAHGHQTGEALGGALVEALLAGLEAAGFLAQAEVVLSGYLGTPDTATVLAAALDKLKRQNAQTIYCCDPVLGDGGRVYVADGLIAAIRDQLLPRADIVTPNRFELGLLAGAPVDTLARVIEAAQGLVAAGAGIVVCTSAEVTAEKVVTLALSAAGAWSTETPALEKVPHGTGDLLSALYLAHYLETRDPAVALGAAVAGVDAAIGASLAAGAPELDLVAAQDQLLEPGRHAPVRRLG